MSYQGKYLLGSTKNLLRIWKTVSTPEQKQEGRAWYQEAHDYCAELAEKYNMSLPSTVAALASLSMQNRWENNKVNLESVMYIIRNPQDTNVTFQTFSIAVERAVKILLFDEPDILKGDKVTAFYHNILYPTQNNGIVTVDIWAYRAWIFNAKAKVPTLHTSLYKHVEKDYIKAAEQVGELPHHFQAGVWVATRKAGQKRRCQLEQLSKQPRLI